ncbi:MAG: lysine transporter LysE [Devosia sp.]|nr:lysine transporter LysE [Devosia sp.]
MTNPWLFLLAVLTVLATPGPTNTLLASGAAVSGLRRSLPLLSAELGGYLITVDLVGLLLRPEISAHPAVGVGMKIAVALYLAYAAVRLWRKTGPAGGVGTAVRWSNVFIATLLNPKGLIFALAIIPFGHPDVALYLLAFAGSVVGVGFLWLVAGHLLGAAAGERRHLVPRIASVALVGFAGLIAASAFG